MLPHHRPSVGDPFSEAYAVASWRFRDAVRIAGGRLGARRLPHARAPDAGPLAIDLAWFGPRRAPRVLVSVCGVHGVEGPAGSAAQLQWIRRRSAHLPVGAAALLVHAANPWGWAHGRRANHANIDLNRNFAGPSGTPAAVVDELCPPAPEPGLTAAYFETVERRKAAFIARHGAQAYMTAMSGGQSHRPDALLYAGQAPDWEAQVLSGVFAAGLRHASRAALIDWHTGIGDYGQPFPLCFNARDSGAFRRVAGWWGRAAVEAGAGGFDGLPRPSYHGLLFHGAQAAAPHLTLHGGVIEFGTWTYDRVSRALIADAWLGAHPAAAAAERAHWLEELRACFAPRDRAWRDAVLAASDDLYQRTLAGLCEDGA